MPTGLTRDAGWQIGVSRTLPHPPAAVWDFLTGPAGLAHWLGPGATLPTEVGARYATDGDGPSGELRGYRPGERVRLTADDTTVQFTLRPAREGAATSLTFHQERLPDAAARERQRAHWKAVLAGVAEALG
ncbi:SRPBCC domain-containing protein [Streptomyces sp. 3MP-14]|uniref:SRPBCC domain-containing protein n=2 Tax=Streptomyces TaxID=1883 RepID=A0A5N6AEQ0_9ACTN|nr:MULTISPECIES: SRPBCC domain-containing protein [Streptomyces]KAB8167307.1 SRPBCC domain-containing protein [Streptomyces mimosae]KAB8177250.1 SRPBCC domain-containing protein [Streptomyces sp. 3MP-14]